MVTAAIRRVQGLLLRQGSVTGHAKERDLGHEVGDLESFGRPDQGLSVKIDALLKDFGGVHALAGVTADFAPGKVTGVIGANGSGKTTLLNLISGMYAPSGGEIKLDGGSIVGSRTDGLARLGVARTFQTPIIPSGLSALDVARSGRYTHVRVGMLASVIRSRKWRSVEGADRLSGLSALTAVGLSHLANENASSLSLGSRRVLEVARSLVSQPRLILLDEPAAGLGSEERSNLGHMIRAMARLGATVVLVEHNVSFVFDVAEDIVVLDRGKVIARGSPSEVAADKRVIASYLGDGIRGRDNDRS